MMTTSYPAHGMHPQGMPHGQPMAGPGPNPGHPMAQMQMHPGVSGPNGPVSQAGPMMAGMQPGVGPNAHALSHLQPNQVQAHNMFQQQQQQHHNMQMNPALLQQRNAQQQQAYLRQQQHQQQMLAQQQNGMGMGFPQNMANMNAQQMAALQSGGLGGPPFVNLPQHIQTQLRQQQAMHQQQQQQATSNPQAQAMAAHAAQQQAQAQAQAQLHQQQQQAQAQHQQQQHQMQAQAIAMQHAQSQSSNHSASGTQGPPTTSQPQTGPLRPPSAIGSVQGQASPAPQPTPQQAQQQGPQPQQQPAAQNQAQNIQQQANQQAQNQQIQQRNQAMAASQQNNIQVQAAQQAQARLSMMKQAAAAGQTSHGGAIIKLLNLADKMGAYNKGKHVNSIAHWQSFVAQFFSETGSFIHRLYSSFPSERTKQFEIVFAAMPRYFYTQFNTEVDNLQITIDGATEKSTPGETKVFCDRAKFIYTYSNGCQVVCGGKLTAFWAGSDKMEWLQFEIDELKQYLERSVIERLFTQPSPSQMIQQSPRMSKNSKNRQNQQRLKAEPETLEPILLKSNLLQAPVGDFGLPHALQQYLETYEIMNNMTNLMAFYQENQNLSPGRALDGWVNQQELQRSQMQGAQNAQPMQNQQQMMAQGARTPSGPGQPGAPQFMSPAMANSLLPNAVNGSPHLMQHHTPSPASHPMVTQHSQQGTNSSTTASVNTSPNVSQKRRRSTAKMDPGDDGDVNGAVKVKQSPRVGGNKRVKQNN